MRIVQHQRCKNDANGNPRRLFVLWDASGNIVAVADEGYRGWPAKEWGTRNDINAITEVSPVDITLAERRSTIRYAKNNEHVEYLEG